MYSVVMMMAFTSSAEMPDCGRRRGGGSGYYVYQPVCVSRGYMPVAETPQVPEHPPPTQPTVYPETEEDKKMLKELMTLIPDLEEQKKVREYQGEIILAYPN
jgi:hypothetical protein